MKEAKVILYYSVVEHCEIGEKKPFIDIMQHYYALFVRYVEMIILDTCNGSRSRLRKLRSRQ
jgi:hypothetical protein